MQVGDKHKPESIEKIRAARTGTHLTDDTKTIISQRLKDKPKSEEHKAKMAEAARKRWARVRAEKAAQNTKH
jgi:predicted house-cleaning NTP pyrophosphatase (Maf/HAM1 superfamily)